ncbi:MAG TPA: YdcF family protein [Candidatus Nanopelagicales bacterium]|nr:YdcF family protein [Candidatus Nanopelagicales bacterium]
MRPLTRLSSLAARGLAALTGVLALLALVAEVRGHTTDLSLWWIDLRDAAALVRLAFLAVTGASFLAWALMRAPGPRLRATTALLASVVAVIAVRDTVGALGAAGSGLVRPAVPVPLSAVTAVMFALLALRAASPEPRRGRLLGVSGLGVVIAVGAWAIAFPLAQMLWFGATDYRRPADAAVILGARVYANGNPSPLLWDRLRTGIELYESGLVPRLVMSGGDGADGFNEARVMAQIATDAGVPPEAVLIDPAGDTTELTVRNALALLAEAGVAPGAPVIVVSQAYHLPRVQLAFSDAGVDVLTVPAPEAQPIVELPLFIAREVPAFWSYLLRVGWF